MNFKLLAFLLVLVAAAFGFEKTVKLPELNQVSQNQPVTTNIPKTEVIANNLEVPWALDFLPDGGIIFTERSGGVYLIDRFGNFHKDGLAKISVKQTSESGLHGVAVHPDFDISNYIYLYYTYSSSSNDSLNRVSRFTFYKEKLIDEKIIVDKIPGAVNHDGGRIKFGPDGYLYITTGDALNPSLSQDKNSLAGKILRIKEGEKVEIFSYGHRNPQGITWDKEGSLWAVEHGQSATDELNMIVAGRNYGWPTVRGDQTQTGLETPSLHSGSDTWAPAGLTEYNDSLFFGGLRGQALYQVELHSDRQYKPGFRPNYELKTHFKGEFGRIRDVVLGPDNMLYITTSNRDGRGNPSSGDDKIIRINPESL